MYALISVLTVDHDAALTLLTGCEAHSDLLFMDQRTDAEETVWSLHFQTRESLETFTELLATVSFSAPDFIRIKLIDGDEASNVVRIFALSQFHRFVFHES